MIDAFLDRVEAAADARAAAAQSRRGPTTAARAARALDHLSGTGIPITAIAAEQGGVQGMIVTWLGIVGVNFAFSRKR